MERFYYKVSGQEFGPAARCQLEEMLESGLLSENDLIRAEGSSRWQSAAGAILSPAKGHDSVIEYYARVLGETLGPLSRDDLADMIAGGQVSGTDLVRIGESGEWQPVEKMRLFLRYLPEVVLPQGTNRNMTHVITESKTNTEIPTAPTSFQSGKQPTPESSQKPRRKPEHGKNPWRRRRSPRVAHDPIMQEIYEEVFAPGAKERRNSIESTESRASNTPNSSPAQSSNEPTAVHDSNTVSFPQSHDVSLNATENHASVSVPMTVQATTVASQRSFHNRPSHSASARSFSLPETKTLSLIAGTLSLCGLVLAFLMGWVSLPQLGGGAGDGPSPESSVIACYRELSAISRPITQVEWVEFTGSVQGRIKPFVTDTDSSVDESVSSAARLLIEIAESHPVRQADKINQSLSQLKSLIDKIQG